MATKAKTRKKSTATRTTTEVTKKTAAKRTTAKRAAAVRSDRVDYYPNRMTVAISALAGTLLVLLAIISVLGAQ